MLKSHVYSLEAPEKLNMMEQVLDTSMMAPTDILAKTKYTAVSPGTELAAWQGMPPLRPSKMYPRLMGYCNLAQVVNVGAEVEGIEKGQWVLTHQSHRSHFICDQSEVLLTLSAASSEDSQKAVTATYLYHLGYMAIKAGGYFPGHKVAVIGMGTLGQTTAALLKVFAGDPDLFTNQEALQALLQSRGFKNVHKKLDVGLDADIVINTSNKWSDHTLSMQLARRGGTVVNLGFPGRGEPSPEGNPLDSRYFYDKQLTIKHCGHVFEGEAQAIDIEFPLKRNMSYLANLIIKGRLKTNEILSWEQNAQELDQVYSRLSLRNVKEVSALLTWS